MKLSSEDSLLIMDFSNGLILVHMEGKYMQTTDHIDVFTKFVEKSILVNNLKKINYVKHDSCYLDST